MLDRIEIVQYDPAWPVQFDAERARLSDALGDLALRIDHHGSTSVPGLAAKPVIDIQISVERLQPLNDFVRRLAAIGYRHVLHADDAFCPFFHRPASRPHTHHVHLVERLGAEERRTLAFRDYLRAHADAAGEYQALKQQLAAAGGRSEDAYASAKSALITRFTEQAMVEGLPRGLA